MAVQISGNDITVPRDGSFTRNVTIGGTLTYEDVTNIDSVGLVTARTGIEIGARPGVAASISVDGNMIVSGISTFGGDVQVPDKIIHAGDTNTAIRFPAADTITAETGGSERLRIGSDGKVGVNTTAGAARLTVDAASGYSIISNGNSNAIALGSNGIILFGNKNAQAYGAGGYDATEHSFKISGTERLKLNSDGAIDLSVSGTEADIYHSGSGDRWPLRLLNSDTTSGNMTGIYFGPCNNVAGAYISGKAEADFTSTANRDAGLEFGTRLDGNWKIPMAISAAGYVTKPLHPAFKAGRSSNYLCGAGDAIVFNDTTTAAAGHFNDGGHYNASNGQFTAPVAGIYYFYALVIYMSLSDDQDMTDCFDIYRNASDHLAFSSRRAKYRENYTGMSAYFTDTSTVVAKLAADDYVWIKNKRNLNVHGNSRYCYFCGHLIG